jgi:antitoxin component YwqK of YwqJK toxin-antitoxin module
MILMPVGKLISEGNESMAMAFFTKSKKADEEKPSIVLKLDNESELYKYFYPGTDKVRYDVVKKNGVNNGLGKFYSKTGRVMGFITFIDGKNQGFNITFYDNGNPVHIHYVSSLKDQKSWRMSFNPDGTLYSFGEMQ